MPSVGYSPGRGGGSGLDQTAADARYVQSANLAQTTVALLTTSIPTTSTVAVTGDQRVIIGTGDIYQRNSDTTWSLVGNLYGTGIPVPSTKWQRQSTGTTSTQALSLNTMYAFAFRPRSEQAWASFGVEVSTAATAGGVLRLGFAPDLNGIPDWANLTDLGTQVSTSTGRLLWTPGTALTLKGGLIPTHRSWCLLAPQTATCTIRTAPSGYGETWPADAAATAGTSSGQTLIASSISGALPTTATTLGNANSAPADLWLQAA